MGQNTVDLVGDPIVLRVPREHGNRDEDEDEGDNPVRDDHSLVSLALFHMSFQGYESIMIFQKVLPFFVRVG